MPHEFLGKHKTETKITVEVGAAARDAAVQKMITVEGESAVTEVKRALASTNGCLKRNDAKIHSQTILEVKKGMGSEDDGAGGLPEHSSSSNRR